MSVDNAFVAKPVPRPLRAMALRDAGASWEHVATDCEYGSIQQAQIAVTAARRNMTAAHQDVRDMVRETLQAMPPKNRRLARRRIGPRKWRSDIAPLPNARTHPWELVEMTYGEPSWKMWRYRWRWQARRGAKQYWRDKVSRTSAVTGYEIRRVEQVQPAARHSDSRRLVSRPTVD